MLVDKKIMDEIYGSTGIERLNRAREYFLQGKVNIIKSNYNNPNEFYVEGMVNGKSGYYRTCIDVRDGEIEDIHCECLDYERSYGSCKHIAATLLQFTDEMNNNGIQNTKKIKYLDYKQLIDNFYEEEVTQKTEEIINKNNNIKLVPKLFYDEYEGQLRIEFKLGNTQLYKLRNLVDFYKHMQQREFVRYGNKLEFIHEKENFEENSRPLLKFVLKHAEIISYVNSNANSNYRYYGKALNENSIIISNSGIDELFDILKNEMVEFETAYKENKTIKLEENNPDIMVYLNKINTNEYQLSTNIDLQDYIVLLGRNYTYLLLGNTLYKCDTKFSQSIIKLLEIFRKNYINKIKLPKEELSNLYAIVLSKMKPNVYFNEKDEEEIRKYVPKTLGVKVYLDFDSCGQLLADILFCYEDFEFNPLNLKENIEVPRDVVEETKTLNIFLKTGFLLDTQNLRFILTDEEKIYKFLLEDIDMYMKKFEVLVTENFKTKQIKPAKLGSIGVKVDNNFLNIDLSNIQMDKEELKQILEKYNLKKKYHRLKDGSFINIQESEEISFIDKLMTGMDIDYKQIEEGKLKLPVSRSLYLNKLLENLEQIQVEKDSKYTNMINQIEAKGNEEILPVPKQFEKILRYYQKNGYEWLKTIEKYNFGAILADDMGLGKTIQLLAVITSYINNNSNPLPSIVIAPSSLVLNWQKEAKIFAPNIKVLVIHGKLEERKKAIEDISKYGLIITSYELLKRDIEKYKEKNYLFQYIIADEAQYIKNSITQNAKTIKEINGNTRFALTGTPIENSLSELWSIFDFIMPGYLFNYKKFKDKFEIPIIKEDDDKALQKLKMLIEPFVLRRTKKEVLTELPDKTITILENEMEEEQQKIYLSYLAQAKQEMLQEIQLNGIQNSQIKILSLLTRLRQICCHPKLFLSNYIGVSSKLEQCIELIKDAIQSGHKILLFSGYTSMFEIIEKKLKQKDINYLKLTGQTKVDERIELVDKFNQEKEIKVFLISLKAGGTGLNLTGADMVIHYDPWWNASAENQATDRAYRIGQKNNVQVYKLITKNSIEEKIYELQKRKEKLIDSMLDTKTSFISKLTKEEIMSLFDN